MPQLCSFSGQRRWGSTRKARGVRSTNKPRITASVRVKYRRQSSPTLSSRSLVIRTISSWDRLCSDVPVMAVVVSPQLSSCKQEKEKEISTSWQKCAAYFSYFALKVNIIHQKKVYMRIVSREMTLGCSTEDHIETSELLFLQISCKNLILLRRFEAISLVWLSSVSKNSPF